MLRWTNGSKFPSFLVVMYKKRSRKLDRSKELVCFLDFISEREEKVNYVYKDKRSRKVSKLNKCKLFESDVIVAPTTICSTTLFD